MVTAVILINAAGRDCHELGEEISTYAGISELHIVAGEYDMVAVVRVADNAQLSELVTRRLVHTEGVKRTKTLFALESLSRFDLSGLFEK